MKEDNIRKNYCTQLKNVGHVCVCTIVTTEDDEQTDKLTRQQDNV